MNAQTHTSTAPSTVLRSLRLVAALVAVTACALLSYGVATSHAADTRAEGVESTPESNGQPQGAGDDATNDAGTGMSENGTAGDGTTGTDGTDAGDSGDGGSTSDAEGSSGSGDVDDEAADDINAGGASGERTDEDQDAESFFDKDLIPFVVLVLGVIVVVGGVAFAADRRKRRHDAAAGTRKR